MRTIILLIIFCCGMYFCSVRAMAQHSEDTLTPALYKAWQNWKPYEKQKQKPEQKRKKSDTTTTSRKVEEKARFTSTDPLWEKYRAWSPYVYSMNNPLSIIDPSGASGEAVIDNDKGEITVTSTIHFYGEAASESMAKRLSEKIQADYNAAGNQGVTINGKVYTMKFIVEGKYLPSRNEALSIVAREGYTNGKNNFIRLESGENMPSGSSSMEGVNTGIWYEKDYLESDGSINSTPAHEFGHGYMFAGHSPYWDGTGTPHIMVGGDKLSRDRWMEPTVQAVNLQYMIFVNQKMNHFEIQNSGRQNVIFGRENGEIP